MSYLYKTLWCVALIILTEILKVLLHGLFPNAIVFIHNLLSFTEVIVIMWTIISLLQGPDISGKRNFKKIILIFLSLAIPELLLIYWLHHPEKIPRVLNSSFRYYYSEAENNVIQFNPLCSIYDSSLFYTLRPSAHFIYNSYEFSDSFNTNSFGLRDDENSLQKPEIVCLGDSYAMGWGVAQNETFAEILSTCSGKKVLNASVSSYGTARELKNLYRLDTSNLRYLIIQYCRNDFTENKTFVESNYKLKISSEIKYNAAVSINYWSKLWFPGKHFTGFCKLNVTPKLPTILHFNKSQASDSFVTDLHQAAWVFADLLSHSTINFNKVKVLVVDLNEKEILNNDFINEVIAVLSTPEFKTRFNNNLIMVPVADVITENDYYILDTHLRPSGHRKIAERLNKLILSNQ